MGPLDATNPHAPPVPRPGLPPLATARSIPEVSNGRRGYWIGAQQRPYQLSAAASSSGRQRAAIAATYSSDGSVSTTGGSRAMVSMQAVRSVR